jgi:hypothetical protein
MTRLQARARIPADRTKLIAFHGRREGQVFLELALRWSRESAAAVVLVPLFIGLSVTPSVRINEKPTGDAFDLRHESDCSLRIEASLELGRPWIHRRLPLFTGGMASHTSTGVGQSLCRCRPE